MLQTFQKLFSKCGCSWIYQFPTPKVKPHVISVTQTTHTHIRFTTDTHTSASVRRSALWSVENFMESVFLPPFFMVMINSLLAGALTLGTMLTNSLYGHCDKTQTK